MSEAERFCDEKTTVLIPSIALNYDGNMLESVGIGGEMFRCETPLNAENRRLRAENAKLRELVLCLLTCASYDCLCDSCPLNGGPGIWEFEDFCDGLLDRVHELGIEVK